uniref:Reversion-inducing cysteine-rich protein with Kazal motifs n=1 Tax=Oreochromis niloticus TaxID=8128 RepID=A0A669BJD5_ORENI
SEEETPSASWESPSSLYLCSIREDSGSPGPALTICCSKNALLTTIKSESRLKHLLQRLPGYCSESMNELWMCINSTLPGVSRKSEGWVGLGCCELAITTECRKECKQASSKNDITKVCKKTTEVMGSTCCSYAGRHTTCREYCQAIFRTDSTPTVSQISAVKDYCQTHSAQLIHCVNNFTKSYPIHSPVDSLYCCDRAATHCQMACRQILRTMSTEHEIMEGLIKECGSQPLPQEPMWQCFLSSVQTPSITPEDNLPAKMDCAKLHCCSKANTSLCRPTELFRSCNIQSDQGAMNDIKLWSNGTIKMPFMNIPVLDIRKCQPHMWKAVACSLQIKPCHSRSRGSVICKSDCVDILTQCGDTKRFHEGQTPERICELLSPIDDPEHCIPLYKYLTPSSLGTNTVEEVIHPCNPNPCPSNHICQVNRKGCLDELNCQPYLCVPGCKMGEASEFLVQQDARIQVPTRTDPTVCFEVCSCGPSGRLENCVEMPCMDTSKPCIVGGQRKSHGTSFKTDCHNCYCFAGETVCSTKECLSSGYTDDSHRHFTGLPCSCQDRFVPVCASNGRTYPSACVARCMGFKDSQFVFGPCHLSKPCASKPCQRNQRCIPKYRVCLSDVSDCPQYECIGHAATCDKNSEDPACDTEGMDHRSLCHLHQAGKTLAYMGRCQEACRKPKQVCGHNGETYNTVCGAYSDRVAVDYEAPCRAVGAVSDVAPDSACSLVSCPSLSTPGCHPVTPPGACCPICASILQILWSKERMNTFSKVWTKQPVTVHDVLQILRPHISVPQCDVFGYLSIDHLLVVIIAPVDQQPTPLQIEACSKEAEKIDSLINYASPTLVSHVPLSAFLTTEIKTSSIRSSGSTPSSPLTPALCFLLGLLVTPAPVL